MTRKAKDSSLKKEDYETIDLSIIEDLRDEIFSLLSDKPLFYLQQDFKKLLFANYKRVAKDTFLLEKKDLLEEEATDQFIDGIQFVVDEKGLLLETVLSGEQNLGKKKNQIENLMAYLQQLPVKKLEEQVDGVVVVYLAYYFALKLLMQSAYVPQIVSAGDKYYVRYLPALLNEKVQTILGAIEKLCPVDLVLCKKNRKKHNISAQEQVLTIVSFFLNHLFFKFTQLKPTLLGDRVIGLFFLGSLQPLNGFTNSEIPNTINIWLKKLHLREQESISILQFKELVNHFSVDLLVENKKKELEKPLPIADILNKPQYTQEKVAVLKSLALLIDYFPEIETLVKKENKEKILLPYDKFGDILINIIPVLRLLGIKILLPKAVQKAIKPAVTLSIQAKESENAEKISFLQLEDLLSFERQVALGDKTISAQEFSSLVKEKR